MSEFVVQMYTALIATFERDRFFGVLGKGLLGGHQGQAVLSSELRKGVTVINKIKN